MTLVERAERAWRRTIAAVQSYRDTAHDDRSFYAALRRSERARRLLARARIRAWQRIEA